jgi:hypothetical protein
MTVRAELPKGNAQAEPAKIKRDKRTFTRFMETSATFKFDAV